jgi:preprotein translocase subunit SecG
MENVVLVIHLILALSLIGAVLLQRSEGGGLGMGGGSGVMSARGAATAMGKVTWGLAICFICTSIALTIIAAEKSAGVSVIDRLGAAPVEAPVTTTPDLGSDLLMPNADDGAPLLPSGN